MSSHRILNDFVRSFEPGGPGTPEKAEEIRNILGAQASNTRLTEFSRGQYLGDNEPPRVVSLIRPTKAEEKSQRHDASNCTAEFCSERVMLL